MLRSKSRFEGSELGKKKQKSALSRTISASKFCRGDGLISQIEATALKPVDRNNANGANEKQAVNQLTEELKMTKTLLEMAEYEKDQALDELQKMKLEKEVPKQTDTLLVEKDMLIDGLEVELSIFKASKSVIMESLSESKRRIKELEDVIELLRVSENKTELEKARLENLANSELNSLKSELKLTLEEREKSKREIDNLALALNEAKMMANTANEILRLKEMELQKVKQDAEQNMKLLTEAKRENERYKNTVERLMLEADESLMVWNEREMGFVNCVKDAEDERTGIQQENIRLVECIKSANTTVDMFREENLKLKAVLKQATGIDKIEKSSLQLDNTHTWKEDLEYFSRENCKLSVKEFNRPLIVASTKDPKTDNKKEGAKAKSMKTMFDESNKGKMQNSRLSSDLNELKRTNSDEDVTAKVEDEVPVEAKIVTGSIFDTADRPTSLTRRVLYSFLSGKTGVHSENLSSLEVSDIENSRHSWNWKRRALLQSFEDLIKKRSVEKEVKSVN